MRSSSFVFVGAVALSTIASLAWCVPTQLAAADAAHPVVPGFERWTGDAASGGRLLLGELNCTSCHTPPGQASVAKKQAPILDAVASRVHPEFIREFLANPHSVKPGTTMPDLFAGVPEADKSRQIDAITHYLALTGTLGYAASNGQWAKKGEQLFHQVGCVACHDPRSAGSTPIPGSVPLGPLDKKYSIPSLRNFLSDPLAVRPSGRMPSLNLTQDEARDIASYLLGAQTMPANLNFSYYEGTWDKLPDFSQLKPKSTGKSSGFDLRVGRSDNFAMRFTGFLHIAKDGEYRFHLGSDDGSRLLVDGKQVVIMDGVHPPSWGNGAVKLTAGVHEVVVEFFEAGGGEELYVDYEGGGVARQSIEFALTLTKDPPQDAGGRKAFTVNPTLAEQGKKLFVEVGCAKCHQLGPQAPASQTELLAPPELARLKSSGGCLEAAPRRGVPSFGLSAAQRTALSAALEQQRGGGAAKAPTADESIQATMVQFNCIACHQRGMLGGVPEARNKFFVSNQPEMGDEGRIPPSLAGAGAKLKAEWLKHLLDSGAKDRPYMFTRMPKFGGANVGHLVESFAKADPEPAYTRVTGVTDGLLKSTGRRLVGSQGYSCIKCHTWGNVPATGIQSIGMTTMTKRLREAWFHSYILDPQAYRPGTRMPAAWPMGQSLLPMVLGGDTSKQIHSVWAFLADGDRANMPLGLGRDPIELVAVDEPVIYRNFIEGAGPRAIGVGYPEKVNLAWDANDLRPALIWQGSFIDAQRHWTDRGVGFQGPLGDNVFKLASGVEWARLDTPDSPWPADGARKLGYQFRGYQLDAKSRPAFKFSAAGVDVVDQFEPRTTPGAEHAGFRRTLTVSGGGSGSPLVFRVAAGKIVAGPDRTFVVDEQLKLKIESDPPALIRKQGNRQELIVPVGPPPQKIVVDYTW